MAWLHPGGPGGPGNGGGAGGSGAGTGGAGQIVTGAVGDASGDVQQVLSEVEGLGGDTVSNLGAGRKLLQNAGTGAGCDAIFSDFDTSTGECNECAWVEL